MDFGQLVEDYGYLAVVLGVFLEGETVLVLAGLLAQRGYMQLAGVMAAAYAGSLLSDQLYFQLGRVRGMRFLRKRPQWQVKTLHVFRLLHNNKVLLIVGFRFVYGVRMIIAFVIGASGVRRTPFFILNAIGAVLWTLLYGFLGYTVGEWMESILGGVKEYETYVFWGILAVGALAWLGYWIYTRKRPPSGRLLNSREHQREQPGEDPFEEQPSDN